MSLEDRPLRIAVFVSGVGSNMLAIDKACKNGEINGKVNLVIASMDCEGARSAVKLGIPVVVMNMLNFKSRDLWDIGILEHLLMYEIDLICLAGFMYILGRHITGKFEQRILNLHPGLLPDYAGKDPQIRALRNKEPNTGNTVHIATSKVDDHTTVLAVDSCIIKVDDNIHTLSKKLKQQGYATYISAIQKWDAYYRHTLLQTGGFHDTTKQIK